MKRFALNALTRLHKNESGQGLAEYLLVLALVALAATAGMQRWPLISTATLA